MKELASMADLGHGGGAFQPRHAVLTGIGADRALHEAVERAGFTVETDPAAADFVISYGGDGSMLGANREYPDLPIVPLRPSRGYDKCPRHHDTEVLARIHSGEYSIARLPRLAATVGGREFTAINDIVLHNQNVTSAVRCIVRIDGARYGGEVVGDGIVVATPFGSSAYYRSITNSVFRVGLGLAFNNSTESVNHMVLHPSSTIEVEVTRGPAIAVGDNMTEPAALENGEVMEVHYARHAATIWEIETLFCMECVHLRTNEPAGFRHV